MAIVGGVTIIVILLLAALLQVLVGVRVWAKRPESGTVPFVTLTSFVAIVCLGYACMEILDVSGNRMEYLEDLVAMGVSTLWVWFVLAYTSGREALTTRRLALLVPIPLLGSLAYTYGAVTNLPVDEVSAGIALLVFALPGVYAFGLVFAGIALLSLDGYRYPTLSFRQTTWFSIGAFAGSFLELLLWVVVADTPSQSLSFKSDGAAGRLAFGLSALVAATAFAIATERYSFAGVPVAAAVGREKLVDTMDDLVFAVDEEYEIVDINDAAMQALDLSLADAIESQIDDLLPAEKSVLENDALTLQLPGGRRYFEVDITPISATPDQTPDGWTVKLYDATAQRTRRQRLEVLNRVLRHNLRNELTAVLGIAKEISRGSLSNERGSQIVDSANELITLSEKAREIEKMMSTDITPETRTDLSVRCPDIVQQTIADLNVDPDTVDLTISCPDGITVLAPDPVVTTVVGYLVENAVEHHDGEPTIDVTVKREGEMAMIAVADDGPGIPSNERAVLEAGTETSLAHGSGLGLWGVTWGVARVGGTVEINDRSPRGTVVEVRMPIVDSDGAIESSVVAG